MLLAFVVSNLMNVYAIVTYQSEWKEVFTYLPIILLLSVLIYLLVVIIRGIGWLVIKGIGKVGQKI